MTTISALASLTWIATRMMRSHMTTLAYLADAQRASNLFYNLGQLLVNSWAFANVYALNGPPSDALVLGGGNGTQRELCTRRLSHAGCEFGTTPMGARAPSSKAKRCMTCRRPSVGALSRTMRRTLKAFRSSRWASLGCKRGARRVSLHARVASRSLLQFSTRRAVGATVSPSPSARAQPARGGHLLAGTETRSQN